MKELERDLGLPSVLAISIGAMIGSGIFILPALALSIAGPAVILAYLLAGVLVVPIDAEAIPTDRRPPAADLLVRRGADHRLRGALAADDQPFTQVAGTTVTVYPRESRRPSLPRRLLERYLL